MATYTSKLKWAWQASFLSHILLILELNTTFEDVQMMFKWFFDIYLYWFQILEDQCRSVPSIPIAVQPVQKNCPIEGGKRSWSGISGWPNSYQSFAGNECPAWRMLITTDDDSKLFSFASAINNFLWAQRNKLRNHLKMNIIII